MAAMRDVDHNEFLTAKDGFSAGEMRENAAEVSDLLKSIAHEGRLMILCHLASGEKSVTELEHLLAARQATVSQQLARLRAEGIVADRREGKTIHYSIKDERVVHLLGLVYNLFCVPKQG